ncbi:hypothetical protein Y032_0138g2062 [Ancylostoma ceylanicum]|uniref:C-type lectin domain-containing protein n=1 Tax=Ancylostoma ceylanicum TaxID=53326 RepID=A0A016T522_9BILA|nr:hypothetical protein Y032_0138g2062 [Ancylostoma ceylanicum]
MCGRTQVLDVHFTTIADHLRQLVKARKECTFVSFADRLWGHIECEAHRPILCEAKALEPPPPTTTPPSRCVRNGRLVVGKTSHESNPSEASMKISFERSFAPACRTGFHYFPDTNKCYKVSGKRINFKTARDNCLGVPSRNPPELTSILSEAEMKMVHDLAYNIPNQGMFWIGLQLEDEEWKWTNGDFMNGTSYTNWATGYPREAPNSECVAYWMLSGWANTNCEDKYHAVCSYTPDLIQN